MRGLPHERSNPVLQDLPLSHEPAIGETPIMHAIRGFGKEAKTTSALGPLRNHDARKGQEKGKVVFRGSLRLKPDFQMIDFKRINGRGEWIRTTDLLVPNQAL